MRATLLVAALAASILPSACGGSEDAAERFAADAADAVCNNIGSCCTAAGFSYDAAGCRLLVRTLVEFDLVDRARGAGASYDARGGAECLDYLRTQALACDLRDELVPCRRAFVGGKPPGSPCGRQIECARAAGTDADCTFGAAVGQLSCEQKPHGTLGAACDTTCTDLIDGSACTGSVSTGSLANCWTNDGLFCGPSGRCEATLPLGAACSELVCEDATFCKDGACALDKPEGAACATDRECDERCEDGVCIRSRSDFISDVYCSGRLPEP